MRNLYPLILTALLMTGCAGVGPTQINEDRIDYNLAIIDSWKRQLLLNIVKIRYVEPIFFMDVGDVVTSYTMETGGNFFAGPTIHSSPASTATQMQIGGNARYTDRPTITYRPLSGNDFFRGVMSPMPLRNLLASIESGASGEFLFNLGVRSINGLYNESFSFKGYKGAENAFSQVTELLAFLQERNGIHIVSGPKQAKGHALYLQFTNTGNDADTGRHIEKLQTLLKLDKKVDKYLIGFGSTYANDKTIMLQTYTLAQVLAFISERIDLAEGKNASKRTAPSELAQKGYKLFDKVMIHTSRQEPEDAFTKIKYRDQWFFVEDSDLNTKRVFSFIMLAFTMMDKEDHNSSLQLTIPTQ